MKFALVDNNRVIATKGAKGICPNCGSKVIARCGEIKVDHWAHNGIRNCDPWWENETEWHRIWKDHFPSDWQEKTFTDTITGEKHRADIYTENELIIEFQHSHLDPKERLIREQFYKNIIWVVDGTRLKRDYPRFLKGKDSFRSTNTQGQFMVDFPDECFPSSWIGSSRPVIFDFKGTQEINDQGDWRNFLYYLAPNENINTSIVTILTRESFIINIINGKWFNNAMVLNKPSEANSIMTPSSQQKQSPYFIHRGRIVKRRKL